MARPRKLGYGEGSVYEDTSKPGPGPHGGTYRGAITIDGVRRRVSGATRSEALAALDELRSALAQSLPTGDDTRLSTWIDWWLDTVGAAQEDSAEATEYNYRWALTQAAPIGGKRLRDLTTGDVEGLLRQLATRKPAKATAIRAGRRGPLGRSSLSRVRFALGVVLEEAVRRDMVGRNVARAARLPKGAAKPVSRRSLTPGEAESLMEAAKGHRLEALVAVMLYCGLRPGEVTGLTWECVDFRRCELTVRQSRKVSPGGIMTIGETKAHSDRIQQIPDSPAAPVLGLLRDHQNAQKKAHLAAKAWEDNDLVFPNEIGRPIDPSNLRRDLAELCRDADVEPISPNELRHSAASLLVNAGVPLEEVADFLGHANVRMLAQTYRHRVKRVVDLTEAQGRMLNA
jgi:integrase